MTNTFSSALAWPFGQRLVACLAFVFALGAAPAAAARRGRETASVVSLRRERRAKGVTFVIAIIMDLPVIGVQGPGIGDRAAAIPPRREALLVILNANVKKLRAPAHPI